MIQLSGDGISAAQAQEIAALFNQVSAAFGVDVVDVTVRDNEDDDNRVLSQPVIIAISVGAGVAGLVLVLLLSATLAACFVRRNTRRTQGKYR